jgi:thiol-disulfide isomerase/thioredoxin
VVFKDSFLFWSTNAGCGHCKSTKPSFEEAAGKFADNPKVEFAAVDCTVHGKVCNQQGVSGYPTIKYFSYFDKDEKPYQDGRDVSFLRTNYLFTGKSVASIDYRRDDEEKKKTL